MTHSLTIGATTFEVERLLAVVPTRQPGTGEPRLDLHLVQAGGRDTHVILFGDRAVSTVTDIRRRRHLLGTAGDDGRPA